MSAPNCMASSFIHQHEELAGFSQGKTAVSWLNGAAGAAEVDIVLAFPMAAAGLFGGQCAHGAVNPRIHSWVNRGFFARCLPGTTAGYGRGDHFGGFLQVVQGSWPQAPTDCAGGADAAKDIKRLIKSAGIAVQNPAHSCVALEPRLPFRRDLHQPNQNCSRPNWSWPVANTADLVRAATR